MSRDGERTKALNRIADGLFAIAETKNVYNALAERQVKLAEELAQVQMANLAVSRKLEERMSQEVELQMLRTVQGPGLDVEFTPESGN